MAEQLLEKLFESIPKVRILRLFMQNSEHLFTFKEITDRSRIKPRMAKKELQKLLKIGLIKNRSGKIRLEDKKGKKHIVRYKKMDFYGVSPDFDFLKELKDLVIKSSVTSHKKLLRSLRGLGNVKLAVLSGMFVNNDPTSRTDLLIVGDNIPKRKLDNFLLRTESELGKSIHYTLMDLDEFKYRLNMYDRFLRDILEYPHEKLINKLGI